MAKTIGYSPDELWKAIIEDLFDEFLEYFMPELYEQIDFTKGYIFLEQELKKLFRESKNKKRITDKLVKVYLKNGDEKWILIHIEIQGYNDDEFTRRMFKYFYRIYDKYEKDINAIAIFTDDKKDYKPDKYEYKFLGTKVTYEYNTYKILEQTEEKLLQDKNLFALVILAGLYSIKCEKIKEQKYKFKLNLIRLLRQRKYTNEKIQIIFDFIEGIIRLPETEEKLYKEEIEKNLKGGREPMGMKELIEKYAMKEGMKEGIKKGKKEGKKEGKIEGKIEGKVEANVRVVKNMLKKKLTKHEILDYTGMTETEYEEAICMVIED